MRHLERLLTVDPAASDLARAPGRGRGLKLARVAGKRRPEERRSAEEGEMTPAQLEFVLAIESYKKANRVSFPRWTELLALFRRLGYRKVMARDFVLGCAEAPIDKDQAGGT